MLRKVEKDSFRSDIWSEKPLTESDIQQAIKENNLSTLAERVRYLDVLNKDPRDGEILDLQQENKSLHEKLNKIERWYGEFVQIEEDEYFTTYYSASCSLEKLKEIIEETI